MTKQVLLRALILIAALLVGGVGCAVCCHFSPAIRKWFGNLGA